MNNSDKNMEIARKTLQSEGEAIASLARQIGDSFEKAAKTVFECRGKVVITGIGKAGIIGQKISATLASTGTLSIFLHPVEALHGDLGRVQHGDVVIALSHSGQTEEIIRLLDHLKKLSAKLIAITGDGGSTLGKHADIVVCYGQVEEACPLGLAPTVSTSCMLAIGDALALSVMSMREFSPEDFAAFHPAGSLGRKLLKVEEAMNFHDGEQLGVAADGLSLIEALQQGEKVSRRSGALLLVDSKGKLSGILTDADLRRIMLTHDKENVMRQPVSKFMTRNPKCICIGQLASEALAIINKHRIDELPVVDENGKPVGIVDVQDLLGIKTISNG